MEVRGVICDRHVPRRVKTNVYRTIVRPVLLYGSETWAFRKREEDIIMRTEMIMLRWIWECRRSKGAPTKKSGRAQEFRKNGVTSSTGVTSPNLLKLRCCLYI